MLCEQGAGSMLLTELGTAQIPQVYPQFATVVGDDRWRKRVGKVKQEIRGNRFLARRWQNENASVYQFERLRELTAKFGSIPPWEINNHTIYPAASFAAQVLSIMAVCRATKASRSWCVQEPRWHAWPTARAQRSDSLCSSGAQAGMA